MHNMTESQGKTGNPSDEPELAAVDTQSASVPPDPALGRDEDASSTSPAKRAPAPGFWEQGHKTWRRLTSIVRSTRKPDEQPPFSDD
jgi:hypothetical protein